MCASYNPPNELVNIFNNTNWQYASGNLTQTTADTLYAKLSGSVIRGLTTFQAGLSTASISNSGSTFTVPSSSGQLALVSQIPTSSSYVDLTTNQTVAGNKTFSGTTAMAAGLVGTPSLYFSSDSTTGLYRPSANNLAITAAGTRIVNVAIGGVNIYRPLSVISGGVNLACAGNTIGILSNVAGFGQTITDTSAGNLPFAVFNSFGGNTLASSTVKTTSTAISLYLRNAPIQGTNQTISSTYNLYVDTVDATNATVSEATSLFIQGAPIVTSGTAYAMHVASGISQFDAALNAAGTATFSGGTNAILASGSGAIDFSGNSGIFKTSTGAVTIGPGAVGISGATTFSSSISTSGTGNINFSGTSGTFKTSTGAVTIGPGAVSVTGNTTFSGINSLAAGAVGAPSLYFSTDTTSGFYRPSANNVALTISGSQVANFASTGATITGALSANSLKLSTSGSYTAPSITWAADTSQDTGFYWYADGAIGVACNSNLSSARLTTDGSGRFTVASGGDILINPGAQSVLFGSNGVTYFNVVSKSGGSFNIQHPDPAKAPDYRLIHSFVESPTRGDNIYRYQVTTTNKTAQVTLPSYFVHLNENPQIWVTPSDMLGYGYGTISADFSTVTITVSDDGIYNILIISTRKDKDAINNFDVMYGGVECQVQDGSIPWSSRV